MPERNDPGGDLSVAGAIEHVLEASQKVVLDRIDLLRLEAEEDMWGSVRGMALLIAGAAFLLGAWLVVMALFVHWLQAFTSLAASLAIVAVLNAVAGSACAAAGYGVLRHIRIMRPDDHPGLHGAPAAGATRAS